MDATSSATDSMQCPLPPEVLQLVLQHVDLPQRLGPCSLVCREWRAAANAVTSSVSITADQRRTAALSGWLQQYGGQVEQLEIEGLMRIKPTPDLDLPYQQLTKLCKLDLRHVNVCRITSGCTGSAEGCSSRGSGSDSPGHQQQHLAALAQLTQLHLENLQWAGSLQPLSALTNLRHLQFDNISCLEATSPTDGAPSALDAAIGGAVPHLAQLIALHLQDCNISHASLAHISCLQQLRELIVVHLQQPIPPTLAVPQSLTRLVLVLEDFDGGSDRLLTSSTAPALAQLTALQHLQLETAWYVDPVVLSQMAQLTHVYFYSTGLLPAGSAGAAALLTAIASMTLLQHLDLDFADRSQFARAPAAAYAALTASSHLTYLHLRGYADDMVKVPAGALVHMFAAGRQLPSLQQLCMYVEQQQQQVAPDHWVLQQQGFDQLPQCCRGLRSLELGFVYDDFDFGVDGVGEGHLQHIKLDGLLALSGLTQLHLLGVFVDDTGITNTLAQLTSLQELDMDYSGVSYTALLQLTKLRRLRSLTLYSGQYRQYFSCTDSQWAWQKLQQHCVTNCQECAGMVVLQLQEAQAQLAAQQAQHKAQLAGVVQQLAAQLAQHEAQLAEARQQLAAQQAQHEAQLAGARQQQLQ